MAATRPKTLAELFAFYYADFKPLYSHLQSLAEPPLEMYFEVNAAFDHLSRHWYYGQTEEQAVQAAAAHIKRACFDAFKIIVRNTRSHYRELCGVDTSIIDNGAFDGSMHQAWHAIRTGATQAWQSEGDSRDEEQWHVAYDLWQLVYEACIAFDRAFYLNDKVAWARKRGNGRRWRRRVEGFVTGILTGLVVWLPTSLLS